MQRLGVIQDASRERRIITSRPRTHVRQRARGQTLGRLVQPEILVDAAHHGHEIGLHRRLACELALDALGTSVEQLARRDRGATRFGGVGAAKELLEEGRDLDCALTLALHLRRPIANGRRLPQHRDHEPTHDEQRGRGDRYAQAMAANEPCRHVRRRARPRRDRLRAEGAVDVCGELLDGGVPVLGLLGHRAQDDGVQIAGQAPRETCRCRAPRGGDFFGRPLIALGGSHGRNARRHGLIIAKNLKDLR